MLASLEAGDKLLQTVYLSRWNILVCFLLSKQSTCGGRICLFVCSSDSVLFISFFKYFSKFSKEKEENDDYSEEEGAGGEKEKSAASMKKVFSLRSKENIYV